MPTNRKNKDKNLDKNIRVSDIADQTYNFIKRKDVTFEELGMILARVRKAAASNAKI